MEKKISIGLLIPSSSVLPIGKSFETGVKKGLEPLISDHNWQVNWVPEFIDQGSRKSVEVSINRFTEYHEVDIVVGVVSNITITYLMEKWSKLKIPVILSNIGEHAPNAEITQSTSIFLNSSNTWQQVWSLGNWGTKQFGLKGMFASSVYDAGYSFAAMLSLGTKAAHADSEMPFSIAQPLTPKGLVNIQPLISHIEEFTPDFTFAAFCGDEAKDFLTQFVGKGLHKKTHLLGLPFLLEPFDIGDEELVVYTTLATNKTIEHTQLNGLSEYAKNPFIELGYETGLFIHQSLMSEPDQVNSAFHNTVVQSNRGTIDMRTGETGNHTKVYLIKNTIQKTGMQSEVVQELPTITTSESAYQTLINQPSSGWENIYLGV